MNLKMKKLVVISTALLVSGSVMAKDFTVGFANRTLNGSYFNAMTESVKKLGQAEGWKIITTDARGDLNKQVADVEDMLARGIDVLILNPQDPVGGQRIVKLARDKKIPVVILDSDLGPADVLTRVGPDNAKSDFAIGEYAASQFGNTPVKLAVISGNQGNMGGYARSSNFYLGVIDGQLRNSAKTDFTIVAQGWGGWDQQGGLKAMEDILVAHPDTNAVYAENDDMALGAIRALKAANKLKAVKVYSFDGNKNGYKAIIDGELQATGENSPKILAGMAIEVVKNAKEGKVVNYPDHYLSPVVVVNKNNASKMYDPNALF